MNGWIDSREIPPDRSEPVVYCIKRNGKWAVGIAYWTVSKVWKPEIFSKLHPFGWFYYKPLGDPPE